MIEWSTIGVWMLATPLLALAGAGLPVLMREARSVFKARGLRTRLSTAPKREVLARLAELLAVYLEGATHWEIVLEPMPPAGLGQAGPANAAEREPASGVLVVSPSLVVRERFPIGGVMAGLGIDVDPTRLTSAQRKRLVMLSRALGADQAGPSPTIAVADVVHRSELLIGDILSLCKRRNGSFSASTVWALIDGVNDQASLRRWLWVEMRSRRVAREVEIRSNGSLVLRGWYGWRRESRVVREVTQLVGAARLRARLACNRTQLPEAEGAAGARGRAVAAKMHDAGKLIRVARHDLVRCGDCEGEEAGVRTKRAAEALKSAMELLRDGAVEALGRVSGHRAKPLQLRALMAAAVTRAGDGEERSNVDVRIEGGACKIRVSPAIGIALNNLVDNALRYSPPRTRVLVAAFEREGGLVVEVRNAVGCASTTTDGFGLGLELAAGAAASAGGSLGVEISGREMLVTLHVPAG